MDLPRRQLARRIEDVDGNFNEPVHVELADRGDAAVFIVFAQKHAQARRRVRRRRHLPRDVQPRRIVQGHDKVVDARVVEHAEVKRAVVQLVYFGNLTAL